VIPQTTVTKFFEHVEERAWTDAEKELDGIRQKSENTQWARGYVKALEGLLLSYRNGDDKYIFLPKALANRSKENTETLRKDFAEFSANELHGEYDRGYFKALEDYVGVAASLKPDGGIQQTIATPVKASEEEAFSDRKEGC